MKKQEFIGHVQRRIAGVAIGASTARGMGPKGTIGCARVFLSTMDLSAFARSSLAESRHWGAARKFINIFLRDALYNIYLSERYGLAKAEPHFEVPLDSHVARMLRAKSEGVQLPRWRTVVGLKEAESAAYQAVAGAVAKRHGIHRVHLDLLYWRNLRAPQCAVRR